MITAEIKNVYQDETRGSIVVETEYKNGDAIIQLGKVRYTEESGTEQEIIDRAKLDIKKHCENICKRLETNLQFIKTSIGQIQKNLTLPIVNNIKPTLLGHTTQVDKATEEYKGVVIEVSTDGKNTIKPVRVEGIL